jgi:nucleoside-diphosphate-sugar epimerase
LPKAEIVRGALDDRGALERLLTGAGAVIHLAGAISAPDRAAFFAANAQGTRDIANLATSHGVRRFVHVSSLAAREPQLSDYGASKRAAEEALLAVRPQGLLIVRPPVIYGPGDRATLPLLAQFTRRLAVIPASAGARFSLLYVEDMAKFLLECLSNDAEGSCEIDDGRTNGYEWRDLFDIAAEAEGHQTRAVYIPRWALTGLAGPVALLSTLLRLRLPLSPGKVRELYHSDWLAHGTVAAGRAYRQFPEGFRLTMAWYREQGWLPPKLATDTSHPSRLYGENSK